MCWLIRFETTVQTPAKTFPTQTKYEKIITSAIYSQQISGKTSESNEKNFQEKYLKHLSLGVDFKV